MQYYIQSFFMIIINIYIHVNSKKYLYKYIDVYKINVQYIIKFIYKVIIIKFVTNNAILLQNKVFSIKKYAPMQL